LSKGRITVRVVLSVLMLGALAGCGLQPRQPDQPGTPVPAVPTLTPVEDLAGFIEHMGRTPASELARVLEALKALPEAQRDGPTTLRLALLLGQPGLPFRDDAAARKLVQDWLFREPAADPGLLAFAHWYRAQLGERGRLAAGMDEAGLRAREEKKRADACKDKLEALKNMEKSLIERDKP
jgi:hypothetical protein